MKIIPLTIEEAEVFLSQHGRHYVTPAERICAIGVGSEVREDVEVTTVGATRKEFFPRATIIHGAAILGRNAAGEAELSHIYVDGVSQGYSLLYGAVWRAFKALGYRVAVL